jgi:hypothetical protein
VKISEKSEIFKNLLQNRKCHSWPKTYFIIPKRSFLKDVTDIFSFMTERTKVWKITISKLSNFITIAFRAKNKYSQGIGSHIQGIKKCVHIWPKFHSQTKAECWFWTWNVCISVSIVAIKFFFFMNDRLNTLIRRSKYSRKSTGY